MTIYNKFTVKNALDALKAYYTEETMDIYSDLYKALYTLHSTGLLSREDFDKIAKQDHKLFDSANV